MTSNEKPTKPTLIYLQTITANEGEINFVSSKASKKHGGSITVIEGAKQIPFDIKRVYYLYNVDENGSRGGHAHKNLEQVIIAVSGSVDVVTDDGVEQKTFSLNRPDQGLYLPKMIWRDLINLKSNSICLVLASEHYKNDDYIRDAKKFKEMLKQND